MPIGVILNSLSVVVGSFIGVLIGGKLTNNFKDNLNLVLGICSICMGCSTVVLMENMPVVVFTIILGTALGLWIRLGERIHSGAIIMQKGVSKVVKSDSSNMSEEDFTAALVTVIVLFCSSGTGIYGAIISGMMGDHSILIAKSILDLFTSMIFACSLGIVVALIAIPQFIIFLALFFCAGLIYPLCSSTMINDFKACGGFIMLATGFRMLKLKMFPTADMTVAMIFVMPVSWFWVSYILPLIS